MSTGYFFMLLSVIIFILQRSIPILLNGEIHALHFLASISPLNPVGSFLSPTHPTPTPYHSLCFAFQPLILPHLLSQEQNLLSNCLYLLIFLILNQIPLSGPMQPLHTVTKFLSPVHHLTVNWLSIPDGRVSLCCIFLIIFKTGKPCLNNFNSVNENRPFRCFWLNTEWVLRVSSVLIPKEVKLQTYFIL